MTELKDLIETKKIIKIVNNKQKIIKDSLAIELPFTIFVNNIEVVTLLATPGNLKQLAAGFLFNEGLITKEDNMTGLVVDEEKGTAYAKTDKDVKFIKKLLDKRLLTSGCGRGATFYSMLDTAAFKRISKTIKIKLEIIYEIVNEFQHTSDVFRKTGCVHSSAICASNKIIIFADDIGRHNAVDKVIGECVLKKIRLDDKILLTSGRVSSDIVFKTGKAGIPVLISCSAATSMAVKISKKLNTALLGFARGRRINIYNKGGLCLSQKS